MLRCWPECGENGKMLPVPINTPMNVFVSGPLMFMELFTAVTGKSFTTKFGVLRGYTQFAVKEDGQSAMIPFPDKLVDGVIYIDVDDDSMALLDAFQGNRFVREEVSVEGEGGEWLDASAYCLNLSRKGILSRDEWDEDVFRGTYLKKALASCRK